MWHPKNSENVRRKMIDMICGPDKADYKTVKDAVEKAGGHIAESSYRSIKSACDAFKKYPKRVDEHCRQPFNGTQFPKVVDCLDSGGKPEDCFELGRKAK